jgi:hypothetical protein
MSKILNKERLTELQLLKKNLKEKYNQSQFFRRLYENAIGKDELGKNKEKRILISDGENNTVLSELSDNLIDFMIESGHYDKDIFDCNKKSISMNLYHDMIDTISCLLNILEYSLTKTMIKSKYSKTNQLRIQH